MSDIINEARKYSRSKAERLIAGDVLGPGKVDCSDFTPEPLDVESNEKNSGEPNNSRMRYKRGGSVVAAEGDKPKQNAGRKPRTGRAVGGPAMGGNLASTKAEPFRNLRQTASNSPGRTTEAPVSKKEAAGYAKGNS